MAVPQLPDPPKRARVLSFVSGKSGKSHKRVSGIKINLTETTKEKEARKMHTHADPTVAINEAQPGECEPNSSSCRHFGMSAEKLQ